MTADASYPLDPTDRCGALWHDQLDTTTPTLRCVHDAGHNGTHYHPAGTTWGGPNEWGTNP